MSVDALKREMAERVTLFSRLIESYGPGVLDIVSRWTIESTRERLERANLGRRDLNAVMELLWDQMVEGTEFEVIARNDQVLQLRVTKCLFADEMRKLGTPEIGNSFYCAYDYGFCQGLNPHMRFRRTKTLMNGDDCCNHTYELGIDAEAGYHDEECD